MTEGKIQVTEHDLGFSLRTTRLGEVHIFRGGKQVATLRGAVAAKFLLKAQRADHGAIQQLCARITGNYKRDNEPLSLGTLHEPPRNFRLGIRWLHPRLLAAVAFFAYHIYPESWARQG